MLEPRLVVNQCYILHESMGEDSFCELWRATSIYSATQFLIRFLKDKPELEAKSGEFRRLAMACYSINAPAIMDFVEVESFEGRSFIASEYGGQKNLLVYFSSCPRVRLEHACRFIIELGQGLGAFHKRGIVYACLNAENVLVTTPSGHVDSIRLQKPGYPVFLPLIAESDQKAIFENYGYLSPEAKAGLQLDRRSDIYSLAILFFRFIVGKMPYGSAKRAREGSVCLSYVAKAFARREVPDVVTRIILKALRKDPRQRQSEVIELIAGLRAFMDERRRENLAHGGIDPLAELETLNLDKDRVDATQAVRSLDTADYFRAISEAYTAPVHEEAARLFPVNDFASPEEVERIEEGEAEGAEDDGRPSVEEWMGDAADAVYREEASRRKGGEPRGKPKAAASPPPEAVPLSPPPAMPEPAKAAPVAAKARTEKPAIAPPEPAAKEEEEFALVLNPVTLPLEPPLPRPADEREEALETEIKMLVEPQALVYASDPAPVRVQKKQVGKSRNVDSGGISWRPAAASPKIVAEGMESAFLHAFKGFGAFRFIQEPPPGPDLVAFARVFASFRARGLVVDLGELRKGADSTDLLRSLRESLATGLSYESPQARRALARRLAGLDELGAFRAPPLGKLLFGMDGEEPDPDRIETSEGAMALARTLASLGRRRRPLVLTLRGGEAMGPSAHAVLVDLARLAPIAPFCCFVFYKPEPVPSWHVLSKLTKKN